MYNISLKLTRRKNLASYYISRQRLWIQLQVVHFILVNLQRTQMAVRVQFLWYLSIQTKSCILNHKTGHWFQLKFFQLRLNHRLLGTLSQVRKDIPSFDYSTITRSICNRENEVRSRCSKSIANFIGSLSIHNLFASTFGQALFL
jgi:hypothetical protein